MRLIIENCELN